MVHETDRVTTWGHADNAQESTPEHSQLEQSLRARATTDENDTSRVDSSGELGETLPHNKTRFRTAGEGE